MRKFKFSKKAAAIGLTAGIALGAGGIAAAYFLSTGTGSGSASTGTSTSFTVAQTGAAVGKAYPGAGTSKVTFKITNPGSGHQLAVVATTSASVASTGGTVITYANPTAPAKVTGCKSSWYTATATAASTNLAPAGSTTNVVTVTLATTGPQTACKTASPKITLHVAS